MSNPDYEQMVRDAWVWFEVRKRDDRSEWEWSISCVAESLLAATRDDAVQAAWAFTLQRREEVGQIEEEIAVIQEGVAAAVLPEDERYSICLRRTLQRLQAIRDDLKKGLRV